ncbi:MAG: hypothetical protein AVDCRST_MAG64-3743, partial [uncultured Phycisphaerae bacterium]
VPHPPARRPLRLPLPPQPPQGAPRRGRSARGRRPARPRPRAAAGGCSRRPGGRDRRAGPAEGRGGRRPGARLARQDPEGRRVVAAGARGEHGRPGAGRQGVPRPRARPGPGAVRRAHQQGDRLRPQQAAAGRAAVRREQQRQHVRARHRRVHARRGVRDGRRRPQEQDRAGAGQGREDDARRPGRPEGPAQRRRVAVPAGQPRLRHLRHRVATDGPAGGGQLRGVRAQEQPGGRPRVRPPVRVPQRPRVHVPGRPRHPRPGPDRDGHRVAGDARRAPHARGQGRRRLPAGEPRHQPERGVLLLQHLLHRPGPAPPRRPVLRPGLPQAPRQPAGQPGAGGDVAGRQRAGAGGRRGVPHEHGRARPVRAVPVPAAVPEV